MKPVVLCSLFQPEEEILVPTSVSLLELWGYSRPFFFFRTVNLENPVLQQVLERRNEVLCVLTQKIVTTQKCVISEHVQMEEKCGGMVGIQTKIVQVLCPTWRRPQLELVLQGLKLALVNETSLTQATELFEASGLSYHGTQDLRVF